MKQRIFLMIFLINFVIIGCQQKQPQKQSTQQKPSVEELELKKKQYELEKAKLETEKTKLELQQAKNKVYEEKQKISENEVKDFLLYKWLSAQNTKDINEYISAYSTNFKGIKKIKSGKTYNYNYQSWITDRTKMIKQAKNLKISIEELTIYTYGDEASADFVQYYRSANYADWGPKIIRLKKENNEIKITYEEMKDSYSIAPTYATYEIQTYFVIAGSFTSYNSALNQLVKVKKLGFYAVVDYSSNYSNFNPGYYIVCLGRFLSKYDANALVNQAKQSGISAYAKMAEATFGE